MHITFYGGTREVTGSMHMLTSGSDRILLDCGMFQGRRRETEEKNRVLPFDPGILTNVVLSHAHIDHSGRIPLLTRRGFPGRIVCTRVTAAACEYLLLDSAHIQESDARYLNYKAVRAFLRHAGSARKTGTLSAAASRRIQKLLKLNGARVDTAVIDTMIERHGLKEVRPLYSVQDAEDALECFDGYPYRHPVTVGNDITCTFYDAGHILGSAISMVRAVENGRAVTVCYTGDLGRFDKPILEDPTLMFEDGHRAVDLLVMESTYGNRMHAPVTDIAGQLKSVLSDTVSRGGTVMIPAFAYGRTQELIYTLHALYLAGEVPRVPIYIDSPLATRITRVFGEHAEVFDAETHDLFLEKGKNPFSFDQVHYISSVEDSMALMREKGPHIVIAASGMCEAGRILHHLRYKVHDPRNTVLVVGFMAEHTLGRRILEVGTPAGHAVGSAPEVNILGKRYPVRARVVQLGGFSAHADRTEMHRFLKRSNLSVKKIAVVHGEEEQSLAFVDFLKSEGFDAFAPRAGETVALT